MIDQFKAQEIHIEQYQGKLKRTSKIVSNDGLGKRSGIRQSVGKETIDQIKMINQIKNPVLTKKRTQIMHRRFEREESISDFSEFEKKEAVIKGLLEAQMQNDKLKKMGKGSQLEDLAELTEELTESVVSASSDGDESRPPKTQSTNQSIIRSNTFKTNNRMNVTQS